jgi:N-hydroxyarylamine O-acetyltransferase
VTTMTTSSELGAYLSRLDVAERPPATLETLVYLHRRHLATVPYENLGIMLGRPPAVDPAASLARVADTGRAGYCFHQNGALETVLRELGFAVSRRHGHVWTDEEHRGDDSLNHLVLVVSGLPTDANPGGEWWADVGLGDAFRDPLPLVEGTYDDGGFTYGVTGIRPDGWSFTHDGVGTFSGVETSTLGTAPPDVEAAHAVLSTPPDGSFTRILVVQRRMDGYVDTLRCCVVSKIGPGGRRDTDVASYDDWRAALTDELGLPLDDVPADDLRALWARMREAHEGWDAAGRP